MTLSCEQFWNLMIRDTLYGQELDEDEYDAIDRHLTACTSCSLRVDTHSVPAQS